MRLSITSGRSRGLAAPERRSACNRRPKRSEKGRFPSKPLRDSFEPPSKLHRNTALAIPEHHPAPRLAGRAPPAAGPFLPAKRTATPVLACNATMNVGQRVSPARSVEEPRGAGETRCPTFMGSAAFPRGSLQRTNGTSALVRRMYSGYPGRCLLSSISSCRSFTQRPKKQNSRTTNAPTRPTSTAVPRIISSTPA